MVDVLATVGAAPANSIYRDLTPVGTIGGYDNTARRVGHTATMKAMVLRKIGSLGAATAREPLDYVDWPEPRPARGEVLIRVAACGVCHTELDEIEGRAPPPRLPVVLGHQVVGRIVELGAGVARHRVGDRVGVGWIHSSSGEASENLSDAFVATGRDVDGGYAQLMTVPERYAYRIPDVFTDVAAAPLLCAGAIGYRSLALAFAGGARRSLGLMGFGGSAHLVLKSVRGLHPDVRVHVFAREQGVRDFALGLGASSAGAPDDPPPERLDAVIDTTPAWRPVVQALAALKPGGRLVINAIRKEAADKNALLELSYERHLWMEREVKSVANITGRDIAEFLDVAARLDIYPDVTTYALQDANRALAELKQGKVRGAKVLLID
jgi:propanol-preferring alcohol dehydrogenase